MAIAQKNNGDTQLILPQGWIMGFEPMASRATIWRANQLRYTHQRETCLKRLELPTHGLEGRCSIQLSYRHIAAVSLYKETKRVMGIEPTYLAWKASVLPLNYTRMKMKDYSLVALIGVTGFEPATSWSQTRRSSQAEPHPVTFRYAVLTALNHYIKSILLCQQLFIFFRANFFAEWK